MPVEDQPEQNSQQSLPPRQIPMPLGISESMTYENFFSGADDTLVQACIAISRGDGEQQVYIHGGKGSGKTHLLNACCHAAVSEGFRIAYLPAAMVSSPEVLHGLESLDLICIDDIHHLPESGELPLFGLYNQLREYGGRLVLSADRAPVSLTVKLADLRSRLGWGPVFNLPRLSDEQVLAAFTSRARLMGLELQDEVVEFLFSRRQRDLGSLIESLDTLLDAAMVSKRRVTIPFIKDVFNL